MGCEDDGEDVVDIAGYFCRKIGWDVVSERDVTDRRPDERFWDFRKEHYTAITLDFAVCHRGPLRLYLSTIKS